MDPNKFQESTCMPGLVPFVPHPRNRGCYIPTNPFYPEASYATPEPVTFDNPKQVHPKKQEPRPTDHLPPRHKPTRRKRKNRDESKHDC